MKKVKDFFSRVLKREIEYVKNLIPRSLLFSGLVIVIGNILMFFDNRFMDIVRFIADVVLVYYSIVVLLKKPKFLIYIDEKYPTAAFCLRFVSASWILMLSFTLPFVYWIFTATEDQLKAFGLLFEGYFLYLFQLMILTYTLLGYSMAWIYLKFRDKY